MGIANTHLCAKNQKKLMMKSRENAEKTGFSGIFPVFSAGKIFFPEIRLRHILGIAILHLCAKKSAKTNEPISRKAGNRRTDAQTNERTSKRMKERAKEWSRNS